MKGLKVRNSSELASAKAEPEADHSDEDDEHSDIED